MKKLKVGESNEVELVVDKSFDYNAVSAFRFVPVSGYEGFSEDFSTYPYITPTLEEKGCVVALYRFDLPLDFSNDGMHTMIVEDGSGNVMKELSVNITGNTGLNKYITRLWLRR